MTKKRQKDLFSENSQILTVSDYVNLINSNLEVLADIFVEGEVSEFRISQNKWVTFKLKDEEKEAVIECFTVIFKLDAPIEDGMKIRVQGRPRIYPKYGKFSISVEYIELAGEGSLKRAFELTKKKLQVEGLFAPERKRALPLFPRRIGLITSPDAAAYTDFIKVLKHRFGGLKIYFHSSKVQGKGAVDEIVQSFDWFNQNHAKHKIELVVLTRGGGALEDLQAFNSEEVARAVFSSKIPVVCGIGHERDESLAGFVADLRASTPSNAAELIIRDKKEVLSEIDGLIRSAEYQLDRSIEEKQGFLDHFFTRGLHFINERTYLIKQTLMSFAYHVKGLTSLLEQKKQEVEYFSLSLGKNINSLIDNFYQIIRQQSFLLKSYNPANVLKRGYGIIQDKNGKIIKTTKQLIKNQEVKARLFKGSFTSKIKTIKD